MAGQPFQQWLALTQAARQFPTGDPSDVDISIPDISELYVGAVSLEHQPGSGIVGTDVPVVVVLCSPPSVDSQMLKLSGGADGESGT